MSELVNQLSGQTGLSSDLVHKGLGALFNFLKQELGEETFNKLQAAIPDAAAITERFESAAQSATAQGGLFEALAGVAGKLLGGGAGKGVDLLATLSKLGLNPEQTEVFLPKALALIKSYLPPELTERVLASLPALEKILKPQSQ